MKFYYNPLDKKCKNISGAVKEGECVTFTVYTDAHSCVFKALERDNKAQYCIEMKGGDGFFSCSPLFYAVGFYDYFFETEEGVYGENSDGNAAAEKPAYGLIVYRKGFGTPQWIKGGVMYQIFPDRFCKSETEINGDREIENDWSKVPDYLPDSEGKWNTQFFGGNFKGIESKLEYICKLGVNCIYLNPIFSSVSSHRYDTSNYMETDNLLGTQADFTRLVKRAEKYGVKVILDGVFNHTGDDSVYFDKYNKYGGGAYADKNSRYASWYNFKDFPDVYECWWGIKSLPQVNENSPSYREFICGSEGVLQKWMKTGIKGWRLDVADELPDDFIREIRRAVKSADKDALLLGEVWEDASDKIAYGKLRQYLQGEELDAVMNYPLKNAIIDYVTKGDESVFVNALNRLKDRYPKQCLDVIMNILGTHDTVRILTELSGVKYADKSERAKAKLSESERAGAKQKLKAAALMQFTVFGVPCIYYGDEAGTEGFEDPFNRGCYPWGQEDEELIEYYQLLGKIRRAIELFAEGELNVLFCGYGAVVYERRREKEAVYIGVNLGGRDLNIKFEGVLYELLGKNRYENGAELKSGCLAVYYGELV